MERLSCEITTNPRLYTARKFWHRDVTLSRSILKERSGFVETLTWKEALANYICTHRKRAGLSQRELGKILGYTSVTVFRHEHVVALPPLLTALRYEVLFSVRVSTLFAGMRESNSGRNRRASS